MRYWGIFRQLATDTRGTSAIEYGLILALVIFALFAALSGMAGETIRMWNKVDTASAKAHGN